MAGIRYCDYGVIDLIPLNNCTATYFKAVLNFMKDPAMEGKGVKRIMGMDIELGISNKSRRCTHTSHIYN